jgi:hypothetical protein
LSTLSSLFFMNSNSFDNCRQRLFFRTFMNGFDTTHQTNQLTWLYIIMRYQWTPSEYMIGSSSYKKNSQQGNPSLTFLPNFFILHGNKWLDVTQHPHCTMLPMKVPIVTIEWILDTIIWVGTYFIGSWRWKINTHGKINKTKHQTMNCGWSMSIRLQRKLQINFFKGKPLSVQKNCN